MATRSRAAIILCGSNDAQPSIAAIADALDQQGVVPEVLLGLEVDPSVLTDAADRIRGHALFVLCRANRLDRVQVRQLEGLFSAHKGPYHRMLTVDVHAARPTAVVPGIVQALVDLGRDREGQEDDTGRYMRDVVGPGPVAAAPGVRPRPRPRQTQPEMPVVDFGDDLGGISPEALGLGRPPSRNDARVPTPYDGPRGPAVLPEPDVLINTDPTSAELLKATVEPSDGVPTAVAVDYPVVGDPTPDVETGGTRRRFTDHSGPVEYERVITEARRLDPRQESDATPVRAAEPEEDFETPDPNASIMDGERESPRVLAGRLTLLLLAGVGMVAIIAMAVMHASMPSSAKPEDQQVERRGLTAGVPQAAHRPPPDATADGGAGRETGAAPVAVPVPAETTAAAEATTGAAAGDGSGEGSAAVGSTSEAAVAETATGGESGADDDGADDDDADDDAADDDTADDGTAEGGTPSPTPSTGTVPPPPEVAPKTQQLQTFVADAIADGRLLALDDLIVLPGPPDTMTWDTADERCRTRKLDELRGFRLPSKGQLAKLRKAKLILTGTYWSRTVVGGDEAYSFDAGSGRMNVWLKMEPNGRALCVRKRP